MPSCNQCGATFTRKNNLTRPKNGRCKHVSTIKSSVLRNNTTVKPPTLKPVRMDTKVKIEEPNFKLCITTTTNGRRDFITTAQK